MGAPAGDVVITLVRRAGLAAAALVVLVGDSLRDDPTADAAVRLLVDAPMPVIVVARTRWKPAWHAPLPQVVRAETLTPANRVAMWRRYLSERDVPSAELACFRLTPEQIDAAGRHVTHTADILGVRPGQPMVVESVRALSGGERLRRPGWKPASLSDLLLPAETAQSLQRLLNWVRLRDEVIGEQNRHGIGEKGAGIVALFTGSPGTGKTMAANVIANAAGLDMMQVDLSGVIDKYIGETEKNLERIFAEAEAMNVVLFFDEADALFGSRTAVRDSRDRYANQEVSYLLQRMEHFDGVTVLATNLRGNLDVAFSRRLHFIVHFPDPDKGTRMRLWGQLIGSAGGTDPDDPIDLTHLAAVVDLTGGDLKNIVLAATFDAAAEQRPLGQRHVLAAVLREYAKLGRRAPDSL